MTPESASPWHDRQVLVAGVDGRCGGWVVATVEVAGDDEVAPARLICLEYRSPLAPLLAEDLNIVAIDMPIGLPEDTSRDCDVAARKLLRPHGSRVFPAPPRAALPHVADYDAACSASRAVCGKALSRQTWNLLRSIAEVDELADDERLIECHPEIAFALMNGHPVDASKKTAEGRAERLELLRRWLPGLTDPAYGDDGLDALACAWSAARIVLGQALTLPSGAVPHDDRGRPMRICA